MKCNPRTKYKVVDDTRKKETMSSTCQKVKKEEKRIPHSHERLLYFALKIALQSYHVTKLTVK